MANKERLSEFNKSNILDAANKLFREKGVIQTTVDDIAKKADYSKSTIYVYFKSKDDIYNHLILQYFQMLKEAISETLRESPGFPEGFLAICDALAAFYDKHPLYFESILNQIELPQNETDSILAQIYNVGEEVNQTIDEFMKKCHSRYDISLDISPLQATFTLWAGISGIILLANKKDHYIRKAMGISKEQFMKDGFLLLQKSVRSGKG